MGGMCQIVFLGGQEAPALWSAPASYVRVVPSQFCVAELRCKKGKSAAVVLGSCFTPARAESVFTALQMGTHDTGWRWPPGTFVRGQTNITGSSP